MTCKSILVHVYDAPGQNLLGNWKYLNNWLWMNRIAQLIGRGPFGSITGGSISNRISNSLSTLLNSLIDNKTVKLLVVRTKMMVWIWWNVKTYGGTAESATTAVGNTSICGIRILPDSMALCVVITCTYHYLRNCRI